MDCAVFPTRFATLSRGLYSGRNREALRVRCKGERTGRSWESRAVAMACRSSSSGLGAVALRAASADQAVAPQSSEALVTELLSLVR